MQSPTFQVHCCRGLLVPCVTGVLPSIGLAQVVNGQLSQGPLLTHLVLVTRAQNCPPLLPLHSGVGFGDLTAQSDSATFLSLLALEWLCEGDWRT